ncbi:MAG: hypothetical protein E6I61_15625 [Chloroflexi bacterium]|nr:MAG: hypothetical protein E6I61_15625 [Chloroflexota bacterium]
MLDLLVVVSAGASLLSPWSVTIQPAHLPQAFGYETPACWLVVAGLMAALVLDLRAAVLALALAEAVLVGWFGWATWVVTTPRFTDLPFPFMATDLMGPSWYAAAIGLLLAAGAVVRELQRRSAPLREELWLLTAIPGFGLMRMGRWLEGTIWAGLFITAFYLASADSPTAIELADYGRTGNVPPPYPRGAEWILLGLAALFWLASLGVTIWRRANLQTVPKSD